MNPSQASVCVCQKATTATVGSPVPPHYRPGGALGHGSDLATLKNWLRWPNRVVLCKLHVGESTQQSRILDVHNGNRVDTTTCARHCQS